MTTPQDTSVPLSTYLATAVTDDGDWSDVHEDTKNDRSVDENGDPVDGVNASDVSEKLGAVWGNSVSAMWLAQYQALHLAAKLYTRADATAREALGSDNGLAEEDLCFQQSDRTLWACDTIVGAAESTWSALSATGDVTGPASSTDEAIARFDGAGGKTLQDTPNATLTDAGTLTLAGSIVVAGTVDGVDVAAHKTATDAHAADIANPHAVILSQVLAEGGESGGNGDALTIETDDLLVIEDSATVPGGAPAAGRVVLWSDAEWLTVSSDANGDVAVGDVLGPGSALVGQVPVFDATDGRALLNTGVLITGSDDLTVPGVAAVNAAAIPDAPDTFAALTVGDFSGNQGISCCVGTSSTGGLCVTDTADTEVASLKYHTGGQGWTWTVETSAKVLLTASALSLQAGVALKVPQIGGRDGDPAITTAGGSQEDIKIKPAEPAVDEDGTHVIIEGSDALAGVGTPDGGDVILRGGLGNGGVDGDVIVEGTGGLFVNSSTGLRMDGNPIMLSEGGPGIYSGAGTPEGAIAAEIGSTYHRNDGGAGTSFYVKESGSGNTGWVAK